MASFIYDEGGYGVAHRDIDYLNDIIECLLMKSTYAAAKNDTNAVYAAGEIAGVAGYAGTYGGAGRKVLASKTITKDTTNHRTVFDAADPSVWTLGAGDTVGGATIGKKGAANDTTALPFFWQDFADVPTNGSTFTLSFDASGVGYQQQ